jgi:glycine/D-amino acid oxidase-like deaminating enzyme
MMDVVVIGAGISGAATAYELATAGLSVVALDRWGPAAMASGWTLAGVRQLGRDPAALPLAQAAVADWKGLDEKLDAPTHYREDGNIRLARTEQHMEQLTAMVARAVTALRSAPVAPVLTQVIGVADASCAGRQEKDGRFRFTSGSGPWLGDMDWPDESASASGIRPGPQLMPSVREVVRVGALGPTALDAPLAESWVGLVDITPDALPVIEAAAGPRGPIMAHGFSGHGFCLGPVTGRILAALLRDEMPNLPIAPFALSRFKAQAAAATAPLTLHG